MPREIDRRAAAQQRSARLLKAAAVIVLLGAAAYLALSLVAGRRTPANPDTRYTAADGLSVYYESAVWPVCEETEEMISPTEGAAAVAHPALKLASGEDSGDSYYQVVLLERGNAQTYEDFFAQSEASLRADYGVAKSAKLKIELEGVTVTARRYDIQAYYAVLATLEYPGGEIVYVTGLTKLASLGDIINLVESVTLA